MATDPKKFEIPQPTLADVVHTGATVILGLVPFAGASELFKSIIAPPLEKRRDQWMEDIAQIVQELEKKEGFSINTLRENEEFQSLLIEATQMAMKTHLEEKRLRLKNVLSNNAKGNLPYDRASHSLKIIDQLLPVQMQILSKLHTNVFRGHPSKHDAIDFLGEGLDASVDKVILHTLVRDLENLGLIRCVVNNADDEDSAPSYYYTRTKLEVSV